MKTLLAFFFASASVLLAAACARADLNAYTLTATYHEQWWDAGGGYPSQTTDNLADLWSLEITGVSGTPFNLDITKVTITLPSDPGGGSKAIFDTVAGGSGVGSAFGFSADTLTDLTAPTATVTDGSQILGMTWSDGSFNAVNDRLDFSIDLDNSNVVVKGLHTGNPGHAAVGGNSTSSALEGIIARSAVLTVDFLASGTPYTATSSFWGIDREDAKTEVLLTPAPGAVVLGAMGLGLVGWLQRRARKQKA